ncbi:MAG: FHA domain-containing protein [Dehalococcoidia bacterium]|nr:FHA domain-containing protein [Dehalococcoidia bacterium]
MPTHSSARLRVRRSGADEVFALPDRFTIGRLGKNSLSITDDAAISREHALIQRVDEQYLLRDLGSRNGTFVERGESKQRVTDEWPLQFGDVIHIGAVRLTFERPDATAEPGTHTTIVQGKTVVGRVLPLPRQTPEPDATDEE